MKTTLLGGLFVTAAILAHTGTAQAQTRQIECDNCYAGFNQNFQTITSQGLVGKSRNGVGSYTVTFNRSLKHCVWNATVGDAQFNKKEDPHEGKFAFTIQAHLAQTDDIKRYPRSINVYIHKFAPGPNYIPNYDKKPDLVRGTNQKNWTPYEAYFAPKDASWMIVVHCYGSHVVGVNRPHKRVH